MIEHAKPMYAKVEPEGFGQTGSRFVVIVPDENGCSLYSFASAKCSLGDTWHASIDDAMMQAKYSYSIEPAEWHELCTGGDEDLVSIVNKIEDLIGQRRG